MADQYIAHITARIQADLQFLRLQGVISEDGLNTISTTLQSEQARRNPTPAQLAQHLGGMSVSSQTPPRASSTSYPTSALVGDSNVKWCKALWDYPASQPDDLSFGKGDLIMIQAEMNPDWWSGSCNGRSGIFPSNHVERTEEKPQNPSNSISWNEKQPPVYSPQTSMMPSYQQDSSRPQQLYIISNPNNVHATNQPPIPPKKKFPGGSFGKVMATSLAGGVGFGAGSAAASEAIHAIF